MSSLWTMEEQVTNTQLRMSSLWTMEEQVVFWKMVAEDAKSRVVQAQCIERM